jgi:3-oxoacyl-[acyl-carrier protein] reductase
MKPKNVIVTGTSSGLGSAIAKTLARNGFFVIGISRRNVLSEELGLDVDSYAHEVFDLGDIEKIPNLVSGIVKKYGTPFGLVNNAAIGSDGLLPTMHNSDIEELIRVNVTSPIVLTKYVSRAMLGAREGRIISISSVVASTGYRGFSVYAASKAALQGFTRSLARDLGKRDITVNCIAPGFVDTAMTQGMGADNLKKIVGRSALGRFPHAEEIAGGVHFLLDVSGAGITGTVLTIDAGNSA